MKYVGYLLLLILFIYFVFIKPYIILYKIEFKLEGIEINLRQRSLKLREFLLFIPKFRDSIYFLRINGFSLYGSKLEAEELSVITVSLRTAEKPFDYDFTHLTRILNKLNISLERAYVSVNSPKNFESITVFISNTYLNNRRLFSERPTIVYHIRNSKSEKIEIFVKEAYLDGPVFNLVSAQVASERYFFNLEGKWKGKKGNFTATGFINKLSGNIFSIDPIKVKASGYIDYTSIKANLEVQTDNLKIREKSYRDLKGKGSYTYIWRKKNYISLKFDGAGLGGILKYDISKNTLESVLDRLSVDKSLLSVKRNIAGVFSGNIFVDIQNKSVKLDGNIKNLVLDKIHLGTAIIRSKATYGQKNQGDIEFLSKKFDIRGRFYERDFAGKLRVKGFPYADDRLSAKVFYEGSLYYLRGILQSVGRGSAIDVSVSGINIGNLTFDLNLINPKYQIVAKGHNFQLHGTGSILEKSFDGSINLSRFSLKERELEISDLIGRVFVQAYGEKINLNGKVEGKLRREDLEVQGVSEFHLSKSEGKLGGEFVSNLRNIKYGDFEFKSGLLTGIIKNEEVSFSYKIEEKLKGSGKISFRDFSFSTQGQWQDKVGETILNLAYTIQKSGDFIVGSAKGEAKIKDFLIPVDTNLQIRKDKIKVTFKEFRTRKGILTMDFGRINLEDGKINFEGASIRFNSEEIIKIPPSEGYFNLKARNLESEINIRGYAYGQAKLLYSPTSGFNLVSEGSIDLGKVSKLIRSKIKSTLVGSIYYYLNTDGKKWNLVLLSKEPIKLRSRYLGLPLVGNAYFFGDGKVFKGSANFVGNGSYFRMEAEGTEKRLTAEFRLEKIPVMYKDASLRGNVFLNGKGSLETDYSNLKLTSELSLGGMVDVQSFPKEKQHKKDGFSERISLDLKISSYEPLRVYLPEGYIYCFLDGYVKGTLGDPDYKIKFSFSGGELRYFNRKFHVKSGSYEFDKKRKEMDLVIASSLPEFVVLIDLKGDPDYPKVTLRSEPPKEPRQILTSLISGGGSAEGLISFGDVLTSQMPQMAGLTKGLEKTLGTEISISVSPKLDSSGEIGVSTKISKDVTDRLSVEYQYSSLKNPKESYVGGGAKISSGVSIGGRINSDRSKEVKLRIRGKFGF